MQINGIQVYKTQKLTNNFIQNMAKTQAHKVTRIHTNFHLLSSFNFIYPKCHVTWSVKQTDDLWTPAWAAYLKPINQSVNPVCLDQNG